MWGEEPRYKDTKSKKATSEDMGTWLGSKFIVFNP